MSNRRVRVVGQRRAQVDLDKLAQALLEAVEVLSPAERKRLATKAADSAKRPARGRGRRAEPEAEA